MSLLLLAGLLVGSAEAHHDTATARVSPGATAAGALGLPLAAARPRLELGLAPAVTAFDRAREGSEAYTARALGSITVATLVPSAAVALPSGTRAGLSLPVGVLWVEEGEGQRTRHLGPGDLRFALSQGLGALWQERGPLSVEVRAVGVAPTGAYDPDAGVSVTEVQGAADGEILLMTYDTQASLGAGVWAAGGGLAVGLAAGERLGLELTGTATTPLSRTPDEIAWGPDLAAGLAAGVGLLPEGLQLRAGAQLLHHGRDEVPGVDEETGDPVRSRVGGRTELLLAGGLEARLAPDLRCGLHAQAPLWQRVGGVQLVQGLGAGASCTLAVGLSPERPEAEAPAS